MNAYQQMLPWKRSCWRRWQDWIEQIQKETEAPPILYRQFRYRKLWEFYRPFVLVSSFSLLDLELVDHKIKKFWQIIYRELQVVGNILHRVLTTTANIIYRREEFRSQMSLSHNNNNSPRRRVILLSHQSYFFFILILGSPSLN